MPPHIFWGLGYKQMGRGAPCRGDVRAESVVERPQVVSEGGCPSCGAPVLFTVGTARVKVCDFCQTVVARADEGLYATGRVSALAETGTPFFLGLEGEHGEVPFRFVGHLQREFDGGVWDEWSLAFQDGRSGWLAESEGALHLMFPRGEQQLLLADLRPGHDVMYAGRRIVVEEVRESQLVSAEGELPSDLEHGMTVAADATGPGGVFLTFDFGTRDHTPEAFVGRKVALDALGIDVSALREVPPKKVQLKDARCTQCNGNLDFKAPDRLKRVACPYCGALLDVRHDRLAFLEALPDPERPLTLPLHSRGKLGSSTWTVIGWMQRSTTVDGTRYPWGEYLLWSPSAGFSFLMESNGHWTHLMPIPAGEVRVSVQTAAYYEGTRYRAFQHVTAVTENVRGEFYWRVRVGERAEATEYVAPPYSINADATAHEVTYTHGTYLTPEQVAEAFRLKAPLPQPTGIAPSQPFLQAEQTARDLSWLLGCAVAAILLFVLISASAAREEVFRRGFPLPGGANTGQAFYSQPFEIGRSANAQVRVVLPSLRNEWVGVQVDLVDEAGEVRSVYKEMTYFEGMVGLDRWTEGSRTWTTYVSRIPAGTYSVRVVPYYDRIHAQPMQLTIVSDVPRAIYLVVLLGVIGVLGAVLIVRRASFETGRWYESNLVNHG